ncbi:hypothetical protein HYU93_02120 [Candidatus Daviesbacteria bacterium]|nr:hypothetical protein [Candidatus Daviesbacteria bacterium]
MAKKKNNTVSFHRELFQQLVTLSTSAFGLAAALAWNETIQQAVKDFIEPSLPGSGILSRFIYAVLVTLLAVLITFQLTRLAQKWGIKK